jgi:hypothetical protein
MEVKKVSKLVAATLLVFSASAAQAVPIAGWDIVVDMKWDINAHSSVPGKPFKSHPTQFDMTVNASEVLWGYNGLDKKDRLIAKYPVDYTAIYKNDNYKTSALVIEQGTNGKTQQVSTNGAGTTTNTITFWNNYLDDESLVPGFVTLNMSMDVLSPVDGTTVFSLEESFELYYTRYRVKYDKNGNVKKIYHSSGYVILPGDLDFEYTFSPGDGYDYTLSFGLEGYTLTNECGDSNYATCYLVGENFKGRKKQDVGVMNFNATISAVQSPIPEPETYAMLLAGLSVVGMVSRRRRNAIRN